MYAVSNNRWDKCVRGVVLVKNVYKEKKWCNAVENKVKNKNITKEEVCEEVCDEKGLSEEDMESAYAFWDYLEWLCD
jgi:hypothetical protein